MTRQATGNPRGAPTRPSLRTIEERNALVEQYLPLVGWAVRRFFIRYPSARVRVTFDDAKSCGYLGLIRAAELYDESRGFKFHTYATHWIFCHLQRGMKKTRIIHIPEPGDVDSGNYSAWRKVRVHRMPEWEDSKGRRKCFDPADAKADTTAAAEQAERAVIADELLRYLQPRYRDMVMGIMAGDSLEEIGARHGVTRERVRQISTKAFRQLIKTARRLGYSRADFVEV